LESPKAEIRVNGRAGNFQPFSGGLLNKPPVITSFVHVMDPGGLCTFSGQVEDEAPGGLTVRFGGVLKSLQGLTATTDASGAFTKTVQLQTDGSDTGTAEAITTDPLGLDSNYAYRFVNP
jgi:hypothetical protein